MTIGERIKQRRIKLGLTVDELAEMLGKNRATIYRYESNEIEKLPTTVLEPLAKALNISPGYLMGWEDDTQYEKESSTIRIGEFIQEKMNTANISQAELARRSSVPASTISSIISRNNDRIDIEILFKLCDALECDIEEYISTLRGEPFKQMPSSFAKKYYALDSFGKELIDKALEIEYERCTYIEEEKAPTITISCSQLPASAGNGEFLSEENLKDEEFPDCENARRADIVIPVSGRSMEPVFHDGDKLYVRLQPAVEVGEYGIFIIDGSGYVKEYAEDRLISLNPDYADIYPDESSECKCVGKVLGKV